MDTRASQILSLIKKNRKLLMITTGTGFVACLIYLSLFYVPIYTFTTKLYVRNIDSPDIITSFGNPSAIRSESGYSNPLYNIIHLLTTAHTADRSYNRIIKHYPGDFQDMGIHDRSAWRGRFHKVISAKIEPSTDVLSVTLSWPSRQNIQNVMEVILSEFRAYNLEIHRHIQTEQRMNLDHKLRQISRELEAIRSQIRTYKEQHHAVDIYNEATEMTRAIVDLRKQKALLESQLIYNKQKYHDLSAQLGFASPKEALSSASASMDPYVGKMIEDLAQAQQNYARLRSRFKDAYPEVISVQRQIDEITRKLSARTDFKRSIFDRPTQDIITDMARAQSEWVSQQSQLERLDNEISGMKQKQDNIPSRILGLEELQKKESTLAIAYNSVCQKQMEALIKENDIIDNVIPLGNLSEPRFLYSGLLIQFFSFMTLGFLAGLAIAWLREGRADHLAGPVEVEGLTQAQVLGVLPWFRNPMQMNPEARRNINDFVFSDLASNVCDKATATHAKVLAFISTQQNPGNSIVTQLAAQMAAKGHRILLLNTDLEHPDKHLLGMGITTEGRPTDLLDLLGEINTRLSGQGELAAMDTLSSHRMQEAMITLYDGEASAFTYLSSGYAKRDIYPHVSSRGFRLMLDRLKQYYDFIIVDTPSRHYRSPETMSVVSLSDACVIISGYQSSRKELIGLVEKYRQLGRDLLGVIVRNEDHELECIASPAA